MTHDEAVKWLEQIEKSLSRAEAARKDVDVIVLLRLAYSLIKEKEKETR